MPETKPGSAALLNAPNLLTFSRVLLAIVFFILIPLGGRYDVSRQSAWYLAALAVFLLAVLTDWLDGYVARKYHLETAFGRISDPFVDKLLVCGAFIMFAFYLEGNPYMKAAEGRHLANIAPWMAVIITGRELLISALRGFAESRNIKFGANVWGKQKMVFQSIAICAILAQQAVFNYGLAYAAIATALLWLAVLSTILSGILYISRAKKVLKNEPA